MLLQNSSHYDGCLCYQLTSCISTGTCASKAWHDLRLLVLIIHGKKSWGIYSWKQVTILIVGMYLFSYQVSKAMSRGIRRVGQSCVSLFSQQNVAPIGATINMSQCGIFHNDNKYTMFQNDINRVTILFARSNLLIL